jgi:ABC-type antimicrobial peptide transport system permease subunit
VIVGSVVGALFATAMAVESDRILAHAFPVRIVDPVAFMVAGFALAAVVAIAMVMPARRATAVDPAVVLRQE